MFDVERLVQSADLQGLAERAGGQFDSHRRSHCPLHGGDNSNAFSIFEKDGKEFWKCWTHDCGAGDVIDFVMAWQGKDFKGACEFLGGNTLSDPVEMERLAKDRHAKAVADREAAQLKEEARRKELQAEEKHLFYHNQLNDYFVEQWVNRGVGEMWQGFFCVGGCPDFAISDDWHTPTLTIPIYNDQYEVLNIKHRLLNPKNPKDKYRPERSGLGAFPPFIAFPDIGYNCETVFVIEGEIKAMVTATITPSSKWQYVGVPGRSQYNSLIEPLKGRRVIVVPDPGAEKDAVSFCKAVGGLWLPLPDKIDDLIVAQNYDGAWLENVSRQARKL